MANNDLWKPHHRLICACIFLLSITLNGNLVEAQKKEGVVQLNKIRPLKRRDLLDSLYDLRLGIVVLEQKIANGGRVVKSSRGVAKLFLNLARRVRSSALFCELMKRQRLRLIEKGEANEVLGVEARVCARDVRKAWDSLEKYRDRLKAAFVKLKNVEKDTTATAKIISMLIRLA